MNRAVNLRSGSLIVGLRNLNFHNSTVTRKITAHFPKEPSMTRPTITVSSRLLALLRRGVGRVCGTAAASHDTLELRGMSDHELKDLGIGRSEVPEWSRRRAPTTRPGTLERAPLRERSDGRRDLTRTDAEHRQHDGRQHLGRRLFAGDERAGLRGRQAAGMEHVLVGMKGCGHANS
jgi:hypothetical protein